MTPLVFRAIEATYVDAGLPDRPMTIADVVLLARRLERQPDISEIWEIVAMWDRERAQWKVIRDAKDAFANPLFPESAREKDRWQKKDVLDGIKAWIEGDREGLFDTPFGFDTEKVLDAIRVEIERVELGV